MVETNTQISVGGEFKRYQRQMLLSKIGLAGQEKLSQARVLLVGCGALGTVLAETLVRAGVGHLRIVDRDFIELNNLQRQVLFDENDMAAGLPKAIAAQKKLQVINSQIAVEGVVADVNYSNIEQFAAMGSGKAHLVLDGTDNFETRFLINDFAVKYGVPWIYGACISSYGLGMVIHTTSDQPTGCLRCLFETIPPPGGSGPTCDTAGILGPTVQIVASWQANEAIKILTGNWADLNRKLFSFDLWENRFSQMNIEKIRELADCPVCKHHKFEYLAGSAGSATTTLCGRNAVQITPPAAREKTKLDFAPIAQMLADHGRVSCNPFMLKCQLTTPGEITSEITLAQKEEIEITLFTDGRAIIKGTSDPKVARAIYARYIGS